MDSILRDFRFTIRNMGRSPGLALVIAASLALGIGADTAIFSLIRVILMKSLPVPEPERLVLFHWHGVTWPKGLNQSGGPGPRSTADEASSRSLPYPFFREMAARTDLFDAVFAFAPLGSERANTTLSADDGAERVDGEMISGSYFRGLGARPAAGRLIAADDERDRAHVAVISYGYWTRRFAADPGIVGHQVTVNGIPFTIVGVSGPGFYGTEPGRSPQLYVPMLDDQALVPWGYRPPEAASLLDARDYWWTHVMARLKPGVDGKQVLAPIDGLFQGFVRDALPAVDPGRPPHIGAEPGAGGIDNLRQSYERPLQLLMGMVVLVLVIACANVAVLLLSRAMGRRREFALRLSLGAGRGRLIRQLLTESLLMAAAGGALGVLCAGWTSRGLLLLVPPDRRPLLDVQMDGGTLAFAALVSIGTALLFGLAPAILSTRVDVLPAMKQSGSANVASEHPAQKIWSGAFVIVQVASSLILLVIAALFLRSLTNLRHQPLGLEDDRVLVFGVDASQNGYSGDRLVALYEDLLRRLEAIPGVEAASAARLRLFSGWVSNGGIAIPGSERKPSMSMNANAVAANFVATTGQRLIAGRDITTADVEGRRRVAVVTEEMARYFFATTAVIGQRFSQSDAYDPSNDFEIVGVVANARYSGVRGDFPRTAYLPFTVSRNALHGMYFHVRAAGDPLALAPAVREAVRGLNPALAIVELDSMANQVDDSLWQERLFVRLTTVFSALALTLACIGLYGTISYGVGRRRTEIAVRVALGARYRQVLWMILRQAIILAAAGVVVGIPLSLWAGTYLASMLFGLTARDPATLAGTATLLIAVASFAGYLPARRAARMDPARALKQD